jgi:hypothetical protein
LATTCAWGAVSAGVVAAADPPPPLEPDLVTRPFAELELRTGGAKDVLRLSNTVANKGAGPLEIFPEAEPCDGPGTLSRLASQRVFGDTDGNGRFHRGNDIDTTVQDVGCMRFHPSHNHWHLEDFARYTLTSERSGAPVAPVAEASKVGFCVFDSLRPFPDLPGSPAEGYYPVGAPDCDENTTEGLSVGWADIYTASLPGQRLDVTGLERGRYCLTSVADPSNLLAEEDDTNNAREKLLFLNRAQGTLRRLSGDCRS